MENVVGKHGVHGRNESGDCLIELCVECGLVVCNSMFQKKVVNKFTYERQVRGEVVERETER